MSHFPETNLFHWFPPLFVYKLSHSLPPIGLLGTMETIQFDSTKSVLPDSSFSSSNLSSSFPLLKAWRVFFCFDQLLIYIHYILWYIFNGKSLEYKNSRYISSKPGKQIPQNSIKCVWNIIEKVNCKFKKCPIAMHL